MLLAGPYGKPVFGDWANTVLGLQLLIVRQTGCAFVVGIQVIATITFPIAAAIYFRQGLACKRVYIAAQRFAVFGTTTRTIGFDGLFRQLKAKRMGRHKGKVTDLVPTKILIVFAFVSSTREATLLGTPACPITYLGQTTHPPSDRSGWIIIASRDRFINCMHHSS